MKVVLDTSAIIYLNDFRNFEEILTVQEVLDEVRDRVSSMKLSGLSMKIIEPSTDAVEKIKKEAEETGDLEKLSDTDVKILALGFETRYNIISDDRNIQNIAEKLGIKYISIYNEKITKLITWKKFCRSCKKTYLMKRVCPVCGERLVRMPETSKEITEP